LQVLHRFFFVFSFGEGDELSTESARSMSDLALDMLGEVTSFLTIDGTAEIDEMSSSARLLLHD